MNKPFITKSVNKVNVKTGSYSGTWSGYVVRFSTPGLPSFKTSLGLKGTANVNVIVIDKVAYVRHI